MADQIYPPRWPPPDIETEAAIGRLALAWGVLEKEIDEAVAALYRLDHVMGASITANLGTKAKLEICQSAVHSLGEELWATPDIINTIDSLVNATSRASSEHRLMFAHGQPWAIEVDTGDRWFLLKSSARKGGVKMQGPDLSPDFFIGALEEAKSLVHRWFEFRKDLSQSDEFRQFIERG